MKKYSSKIKTIIANFSVRERVVFTTAVILCIVGVFGGFVRLSNIWTTTVPTTGGTYREGIVGAPRFINPVLATSDADRDLTTLVYNGLIRIDAAGAHIPDLAESWTVSPDGKTYTFVLKPKLFFHDGKPITPDDIIYTVQKIQDPILKSPLRVAWDGVTVIADDERTVTFNLEKPYAGFLSVVSVGIIPKHVWESIPVESWNMHEHNTEPVGSGPYRIIDVARSRTGIPEKFTLKSFKRFALGRPNIDTIIIETFANKSDATDALASRSIDGLANVDSSAAAGLVRNGQIITTPLPRVFGLFLNPTKNKLFADPAIIKALNIAIDKTAIANAIFAGYAHPLSGPLPQMIDVSPDDTETKKLLAEKTLDAAGWKLNADGVRAKSTTSGKTTSSQTLSFSISTASTPELQESARLISDQLAEIGIQVEIKVFEIGALNGSVIRGRDFEGLLFGEIIRHDTDLYAFWHSSQKSDPGLNITGYASARVDQLLESALREPDTAKRSELYTQVQSEILKNGSVVFLYAPDFIYIMDDVRGIQIPPIAQSSDRFALIHKWYLRSDRVWNMFLR